MRRDNARLSMRKPAILGHPEMLDTKTGRNYSAGLRIGCADRAISVTGKQKSYRRRRFGMDFCAGL